MVNNADHNFYLTPSFLKDELPFSLPDIFFILHDTYNFLSCFFIEVSSYYQSRRNSRILLAVSKNQVLEISVRIEFSLDWIGLWPGKIQWLFSKLCQQTISSSWFRCPFPSLVFTPLISQKHLPTKFELLRWLATQINKFEVPAKKISKPFFFKIIKPIVG